MDITCEISGYDLTIDSLRFELETEDSPDLVFEKIGDRCVSVVLFAISTNPTGVFVRVACVEIEFFYRTAV